MRCAIARARAGLFHTKLANSSSSFLPSFLPSSSSPANYPQRGLSYFILNFRKKKKQSEDPNSQRIMHVVVSLSDLLDIPKHAWMDGWVGRWVGE